MPQRPTPPTLYPALPIRRRLHHHTIPATTATNVKTPTTTPTTSPAAVGERSKVFCFWVISEMRTEGLGQGEGIVDFACLVGACGDEEIWVC